MHAANADPAELDKFSAFASSWWDPQGDLKTLHDINPLRLDWIRSQAGPLEGLRALDVGCGGGLLAEAMAAEGAQVTGIDLAKQSLQIARLHGHESGVQVHYECTSAEDYAQQQAGQFDLVTCMELLEHVPDPASVVDACARLVRPGGLVCFSTLNRNPKSFLLAIVAAEYVMRMLPRGTHSYEHFITPSELAAAARAAGLEVSGLSGMSYQPLTQRYSLTTDTGVNYLMAARRPE
ncbi:bifunctional 2-polyprenyl-6-hydroxyphenol methylase/3-demethylubiquinol 3-O-methyltransferase UbiG [Castellaniella sp.]|jgi:2-polyprenyl-6-hydroxyphenyl methylase/3-demethylubiquinone-9 3-methyltransferase|uniref:bifunctional 2-polyprenyl-6-hydroxyphenol methylase/3-demethylubiquinol 3-O-methyltransferase UbiG n=1 Tax=Castellaniella sp. TaxID=1955812 RepID=UPI002D7FE1AD|nr:bifunctional 2-polyprenyl-6-hydroxyphenol methylase/3-demethylubiquinol 3-O-methyltransferase UbiG [Castellaniella sp.]HET8703632.1 bifunctional 2-polyprenyl-6-hydroxyphenol methylase/3-demethylubiquinol 3-O-methyltransferase UbiG [Castellaniella sp.]